MKGKGMVLLLLLLVGMPMRMLAQHGFSASIPEYAGQWVKLYSYTGLDTVLLDSVQADEKGGLIYGPVLPLGMYYLEVAENQKEFLSTGVLDQSFDTPDNVVWTAYLQDKGKADSLAALPTTYASRLIHADRPQTLKRFFQGVDFNDTTLIPTNVLTTRIVDYLMASKDFFTAIDTICEKAKVNMTMYGFVLQYMLKGFTAMGQSEVTDYLLNFPRLVEGEITEEQGRRLEMLTESYQKVRVGAKVPDFVGVSIDGRPYHLYESSARWIIVCFWSTDCEYCHDFLSKICKKLDLKKKYELVTFALADTQKEVEEAVAALKLPGWHFYDAARWDGKAFLDYHVVSTPTVFLLDSKKTIVCKPYDWKELKEYIKNEK